MRSTRAVGAGHVHWAFIEFSPDCLEIRASLLRLSESEECVKRGGEQEGSLRGD